MHIQLICVYKEPHHKQHTVTHPSPHMSSVSTKSHTTNNILLLILHLTCHLLSTKSHTTNNILLLIPHLTCHLLSTKSHTTNNILLLILHLTCHLCLQRATQQTTYCYSSLTSHVICVCLTTTLLTFQLYSPVPLTSSGLS